MNVLKRERIIPIGPACIVFAVMIHVVLVCGSCTRSIDEYIADIDNGEPRVRSRALMYLCLHGHDPATIAKLVPLLKSDDKRRVFIVTQVLCTPADSAAIENLGSLVLTADMMIRKQAIQSLGLIHHEKCVRYLASALADSVASVRKQAVMMLGVIGKPSAVEYIYPALRDNAASVRAEAVNSLYQCRRMFGSGVQGQDFIPLLNDSSELVRYVAVQALGYRYSDIHSVCETLAEMLSDESPHVREEAIHSLMKAGCADAVPELKKVHDLASYKEQMAISEAIQTLTGEVYPSFRESMIRK